jgi:hypothetical protein
VESRHADSVSGNALEVFLVFVRPAEEGDRSQKATRVPTRTEPERNSRKRTQRKFGLAPVV